MQKSEFLISSIFGKMGNITKNPDVPSNLICCRLFSCFGASFDWSTNLEGRKNEILRSNLVLTYATVKSGRNDSDVSFLQGTGRDVPSLPSPAVLAYYYAYSITQRYQFDVPRQKVQPIGTSTGGFLVFLIKI